MVTLLLLIGPAKYFAKLKSPKGVVLFVASGFVLLGLLLDTHASKLAHNKLQKFASANDLVADAKHIEFSFLGLGPSVDIERLSIRELGQAPLIDSATINIRLRWASILRGDWTPTGASVNDANIVAFKSDTRNNWSKFEPVIRELMSTDSNSDVKGVYSIKNTELNFIDASTGHHSVLAVDGQIAFEENPANSSLSLEGVINEYPSSIAITGTTRRFSDLLSAKADLDITGTIADATLLGQASISPNTQRNKSTLTASINTSKLNTVKDAEADSVKTANVRIPSLTSVFESTFDGTKLEISKLNLNTRRSDISSSGTINLESQPFKFIVEVRSTEFHSADFEFGRERNQTPAKKKPGLNQRVFSDKQPTWHKPMAAVDGNLNIRIDKFISEGAPAVSLDFAGSVLDRTVTADLNIAQQDEAIINAKLKYLVEKNDSASGSVSFQLHNMEINETPFLTDLAEIVPAGKVMAEGDFWFAGTSHAEMASDLDGDLYMLMEEGQLDSLAVEVLGADIMEVSKLVFSRDLQQIDIKCAFANLNAEAGNISIEHFLVDSEDTFFSSRGNINLNSEILDIVITPKPHDASLFSAVTPITIKGTLAKPKIRPGKRLYMKLATAAALATLTGPAATIIPFISLGKGKPSKNCADLLSAY